MQNLSNIMLSRSFRSPLEKKLYYEFTDWDLYPLPNYLVKKFEIDLAFPEDMIAIEIDGAQWHSTPTQISRDKFRQGILEGLGWKFERIDGWFSFKHPDVLIAKVILKYLSEKVDAITIKRAKLKLAYYFKELDPGLSERLMKQINL